MPVLRLGLANVCENGDGDDGRYLLDIQDVEDENNGVNLEIYYIPEHSFALPSMVQASSEATSAR